MSEETTGAVLQRVPKADAMAPRLGAYELANLPEDEFQQRLEQLQKSQARVRQIKASLMKADVHYGVIPGTGDKPTLLKPGAEVICSVYGLRPDFLPEVGYGDGVTRPDIEVTMRCELHLGDMAGPVVAVGYGMANSWERKHRYRRGERSCPECGVVGSVIKGKAQFGGGWLCWAKKGGCGAKFEDDAEAIVGQAVGDVQNPDPHDLANTLIKMAKKRAFLDATLTGTASSDVFTQDLEEMVHDAVVVEKESPPKGKAKAKGRAAGTAPAPAPPSGKGQCPFCGSADYVVSGDGLSAVCAQEDCGKGWNLGQK